MNFNAFVKDIQQNNWEVYGVEVYKDGKLVHSYGDTTEHRYPIYSATKAITSIAVGLAVDEGKLDVEKSILEYLPTEAIEAMSKTQVEVYQQITVKRLLTMSILGYPFRPEGESWLAASLSCPLEDVEQKVFDYSNVPAYLVGVAVSCAVGEDLYEYLNRKVFQPLGIHEPKVGRCPEGYFYGASSMELAVHELSKVGLLFANGGVYEGKRILSEAYVKEATSIQQMNREGGYGYFIWKYRDGFSINGKWGQKCYVVPSKGLMVTYLAHLEEGSGELKASMEKHILGMVEIKTERLILRPLGIQYLESVHEYVSDIENTRYMMFLPNDTVEETKEFLEGVDKQWASDNQTCYEFAIFFQDKMIGGVSLTLEEDNHESGELGWIVNKKYWGQGIAPEAAAALVEYAKVNLGVTHFIAHCDAENPGSYRTMEKIGMVRTAEYGGRKNKSSEEERMEYQYEISF